MFKRVCILSSACLFVSSMALILVSPAQAATTFTVTPAVGQLVGNSVVLEWSFGECKWGTGWTGNGDYWVDFRVIGANLASGSVQIPDDGIVRWGYVGANPGIDLIDARVRALSPLPDKCQPDDRNEQVSYQWFNLTANGSIVSFTKSSGNPQGGLAVFECDVSAPGATRVSITSCTAEVNSAPIITVDGPAAATSGTFTTSRPDGYDVCWSVVAIFPTGSATTSGCELAG